jgi:hypothetical protein
MQDLKTTISAAVTGIPGAWSHHYNQIHRQIKSSASTPAPTADIHHLRDPQEPLRRGLFDGFVRGRKHSRSCRGPFNRAA